MEVMVVEVGPVWFKLGFVSLQHSSSILWLVTGNNFYKVKFEYQEIPFASDNRFRMLKIDKGSDLFEVSHDHSKIIYIVTNNLDTANIGCRNSILFVQHLDVFLK